MRRLTASAVARLVRDTKKQKWYDESLAGLIDEAFPELAEAEGKDDKGAEGAGEADEGDCDGDKAVFEQE